VRGLRHAGAAGGIAAALRAVLGAELVSGIDLVLDRLAFDACVRDADLVLTAEGRLDLGSLRNKGPVGVARRAARHGVPTIALVGACSPELGDRVTPFHEVIVFGDASFDVEQARRTGAGALAAAAEQAVLRFMRSAARR
jgi:glycerate kinase